MIGNTKHFGLPGFGRVALALIALLAVFLIAGGSSRADVLGQAVTRAAAWSVILAIVIFGSFPRHEFRMPILLIGLVGVLGLLQLLPLPPSLWQSLPGREPFAYPEILPQGASLWRPLSISPGATLNAAHSIVVPIATLLLLSQARREELKAMLPVILVLCLVSAALGLVQFIGQGFDNPFINDVDGSVSGFFANRNHFTLFIAIGCLIAPVWATSGGRLVRWRAVAAVLMIVLFMLVVLAGGSRAGPILGLLGAVTGTVIAYRRLPTPGRGGSNRVLLATAAAALIVLAATLGVAIIFGRALSIDRFIAAGSADDFRLVLAPLTWQILQEYFPLGTGLGTFDPVFRMHEPLELLSPLYANHAHNDFIEIGVEGGIAAYGILLASIAWVGRQIAGAFRLPAHSQTATLRLTGGSIILLTLIASVADYPARTPMIMAVCALALAWLGVGPHHETRPTRPH